MEPAGNQIEDFLEVGVPTFLDVTSERGVTKRAKSKFRGWVPGDYILMDLPTAPEEAAIVLKDADSVVRFVHEGAACGFDTKILDWCDMGLPFFRIGWPKAVQVLHVRKHARIPLNVPCTITYADGEERAEIHDLSAGGCGIQSGRFFKDGTALQLTFTLPDGAPIKNISATVCRTRPHGNGVFIGCHFSEDRDVRHDTLIFYLTSTLSRMGIEPLPARRVLLVHPESTDYGGLTKAFERAGVQTIAAHNAVDAFYRLRMAPPGCLVLDVNPPVFSIVDLCAAIRQSAGFESVPIFLTGGDGNDTSLASKCTAEDWFPDARIRTEPDAVAAACLRSAVRNA